MASFCSATLKTIALIPISLSASGNASHVSLRTNFWLQVMRYLPFGSCFSSSGLKIPNANGAKGAIPRNPRRSSINSPFVPNWYFGGTVKVNKWQLWKGTACAPIWLSKRFYCVSHAASRMERPCDSHAHGLEHSQRLECHLHLLLATHLPRRLSP